MNSEIQQIRSWLERRPEISLLPVEGEGDVAGYILRDDILHRGQKFLDGMTHASLEKLIRSPRGTLNSRENTEKVLNRLVQDGEAAEGAEGGLERAVFLVYHDRRYLGLVTFRRILEQVNRLQEAAQQEARTIQQFQLKRSPEQLPGLAVTAHLESAYHLGGDYYRTLELPGGTRMAAAFDVSGKNVSASLTTAQLSSYFALLESLARDGAWQPSPAEILARLNTLCREETPPGIFAAALFLFFLPGAGEGAAPAAGGEQQVLVYNLGYTTAYRAQPQGGGSPAEMSKPAKKIRLTRIPTQYPPLGIDDLDPSLPARKPQAVPPGSRFFLYSDGLTEARNEYGELYGQERLEGFLKEHISQSPDRFRASLQEELASFRGKTPLSDDITLMLVDA